MELEKGDQVMQKTGNWRRFHGFLDWRKIRYCRVCVSTSVCIVSAREPEQKALGRMGGNYNLRTSEWRRRRRQKERRLGKAEAESRVDKNHLPVEPIWNPPFVYEEGVLEIHNLSEGTLVCGGVCLTSWSTFLNFLDGANPQDPVPSHFPPLFVKPICSSREIRFMCFQFIYT